MFPLLVFGHYLLTKQLLSLGQLSFPFQFWLEIEARNQAVGFT